MYAPAVTPAAEYALERTSERAIFQASDSRSAKRSVTQLAENSVGRNRSKVPVSLQKVPTWTGLIHWLYTCCPRSLRRPRQMSAQSAARSKASLSSLIFELPDFAFREAKGSRPS